VIIDPVTARWTGALYGLAKKKGALDPVGRDAARIGQHFAQPEARRRLADPRLGKPERTKLVQPALAGAHQLTKNFVALALDRGRGEVLIGLADAFKRETLAEKNQLEGVVESARPLEPAQVSDVAKRVSKLFGKELILQNKVVPELLGGARVVAGARMLDGSIAGRLAGLRVQMLQAALPRQGARAEKRA
jgi:F-type H+-transporting ATPase subunit delta